MKLAKSRNVRKQIFGCTVYPSQKIYSQYIRLVFLVCNSVVINKGHMHFVEQIRMSPPGLAVRGKSLFSKQPSILV